MRFLLVLALAVLSTSALAEKKKAPAKNTSPTGFGGNPTLMTATSNQRMISARTKWPGGKPGRLEIQGSQGQSATNR